MLSLSGMLPDNQFRSNCSDVSWCKLHWVGSVPFKRFRGSAIEVRLPLLHSRPYHDPLHGSVPLPHPLLLCQWEPLVAAKKRHSDSHKGSASASQSVLVVVNEQPPTVCSSSSETRITSNIVGREAIARCSSILSTFDYSSVSRADAETFDLMFDAVCNGNYNGKVRFNSRTGGL